MRAREASWGFLVAGGCCGSRRCHVFCGEREIGSGLSWRVTLSGSSLVTAHDTVNWRNWLQAGTLENGLLQLLVPLVAVGELEVHVEVVVGWQGNEGSQHVLNGGSLLEKSIHHIGSSFNQGCLAKVRQNGEYRVERLEAGLGVC